MPERTDNLHYEKFQDGTVKCIEDEIPFEVPEGWEWCRLGSVFVTLTGSTPSTKDNSLYGNEYPFYKPADLEAAFNTYNTIDSVSKKGYLTGRIVVRHSVLVTCIGATIGKTGYIQRDGICNQQINAILPTEYILSEYTFFAMCSEYEQSQIKSNASATTLPILNKSKFDKLLIVIPPITQQEKIVAKIKTIYKFVKDIEKSKYELETIIFNIKSNILDLAIRGKLVPQDPNAEPASVLLGRIRTKKEELIKQGKLKRDKDDSVIYRGDDNSYYQIGKKEPIDTPYDIPDNWAWSNLKELCNYGECENISPDQISDNAWILDLEDIEKNSGKILQRLKNAERQTGSTKHVFSKNMILYSKLRPYLNKVVLADSDGYCTSEILPLKFSAIIHPKYAQMFLMSPFFVEYANKCSYGLKMPRMSTHDGQIALFAVPPYQEQLKIVDVVEQLWDTISTIEDSLN